MLGREEYADWKFPESPQLLRADNGRLPKMVSELRTDCPEGIGCGGCTRYSVRL